MAGFNAATVVEALDYDFRTKESPDAIHGTIKEPNDQQIADYLTGVKTLSAKYRDKLPDMDPSAGVDELMEAADALDPQDIVAFYQDMAGMFSALCSGSPSKDDLLRLPTRIRAMFYAWLQQEVMSPEAAPGGGSAQVTPLKSAAAG